MELINYSDSALSLVVPLVALTLAIFTRKVLLSLGCGILLGALFLTDFNVINTAKHLSDLALSLVWESGDTSKGSFWEVGSLNTWNLSIIVFLFILGMLTSIMMVSGATSAFADWAKKRITTRRGSTLLTAFLGIFIFVDDYFNSLAVGSVSRPLTDRYKVSRAKLAYLLDSTAAPMCVLMPVSSWGAYIIAVIGGILASHAITDISPLAAFVQMIPMNFYAIFAIAMVLAVVFFNLDLGLMAKEEEAAKNGELFDASKGRPAGATVELPEAEGGHISGLILPILVLIFATIFFMINSGASSLAADGKAFDILGAFENTDVGSSLVFGALSGLAVSLVLSLISGVSISLLAQASFHGAKSMLPAVYILFFAWAIGSTIGSIETGKYLASTVGDAIPTSLLPVIMFVLAGFMAFATGTSWGTFGIMLPIAGDMAAGTEMALMLPMLASVLAGSVFGDHCSPISDTTILSSTGANCHHMDHVLTQLPYALSIALVSAIGYLVLGVTSSVLSGFIASTIAFTVVVVIMSRLSRNV
ncbi:Na+/H+ antiporter NhaC family protein [Moritella sp. 24]|uniref:Na+/H+ antiporter NhaC family protein n=1 Tax=Moritella sp. 24 TaxID=2746230 RepID=UPI001BAA04E6|nr:Na+/H+ antiporter NhaC family protein [Moritella sp. 24]QUM76891.1 Na+/H+ antiporter NhaC family protein [Moritella sp. 24]